MGQYYLIVNLDKQQFVHPHAFGDGMKLMEFGLSGCGAMSALAVLLADGNGRGGGDLHCDDRDADKIVGSWAGDRIVVAGDYADDGKFIDDDQKLLALLSNLGEQTTKGLPTLYALASERFTDVSEQVMEALAKDSYARQSMAEKLVWRAEDRIPSFMKPAVQLARKEQEKVRGTGKS